jgi:hypothetical protein
MIHHDSHKFLIQNIPDMSSIIQLGDQWMNLDESLTYLKHKVQAADYYRQFSIAAVDIHGQNGAIPLDLCDPESARNSGLSAFAVTDFGTLEHVENLAAGLRNVFDFCHAGGMMLHVNPMTGHFPNHGYHYFTELFWEKYAHAAKLKLFTTYHHPAYHNTETGMEVYALLQKTAESKFPKPSTLNPLIEKYAFSK